METHWLLAGCESPQWNLLEEASPSICQSHQWQKWSLQLPSAKYQCFCFPASSQLGVPFSEVKWGKSPQPYLWTLSLNILWSNCFYNQIFIGWLGLLWDHVITWPYLQVYAHGPEVTGTQERVLFCIRCLCCQVIRKSLTGFKDMFHKNLLLGFIQGGGANMVLDGYFRKARSNRKEVWCLIMALVWIL